MITIPFVTEQCRRPVLIVSRPLGNRPDRNGDIWPTGPNRGGDAFDAPASIVLPVGELPSEAYIRGPRYEVHFDRIVTPRFTQDEDELRQQLSDNMVRDMIAEDDARFIAAVDAAAGPAPAAPFEANAGRITREMLVDAMALIPQVSMPRFFDVSSVFRPADRGAYDA